MQGMNRRERAHGKRELDNLNVGQEGFHLYTANSFVAFFCFILAHKHTQIYLDLRSQLEERLCIGHLHSALDTTVQIADVQTISNRADAITKLLWLIPVKYVLFFSTLLYRNHTKPR